jgi:chromate transporter
VFAWLYARYGTDPAVVDLRYGILPVIIAIVGQALVGLGRTALRTILGAVVAGAAMGAYLLDVHELLILVIAGVSVALWSVRDRRPRRGTLAALAPMMLATSDRAPSVSVWRLFVVFLEIGSVLYGSGYVLLAFLQQTLVDRYGWLSSQELLDAVAIGQITPGPVFTTATFVGWQIDGPLGAAVATVGIFLPSFVFVALLGRIVPWMRRQPVARAFLTGVTAASLGLMGGVLVELTDAAIVDAFTAVIAITALAVLVRTGVNTAWLVGAGVVLGLLHALVA